LTADPNRTSLPRPLLVVGIPVAGVLLVAFFVYLGFPYDKLGDRIATEIQSRGGVRIDFEDVGPSLHLAGPGIEATGVLATMTDGRSYRIERAMLRPAWSLAWFSGTPAIYAEIDSDLGDAAGTLLVGRTGGWKGELSQVAVGRIPIPQLDALGTLDGRLDANIDIVLADAGPTAASSSRRPKAPSASRASRSTFRSRLSREIWSSATRPSSRSSASSSTARCSPQR